MSRPQPLCLKIQSTAQGLCWKAVSMERLTGEFPAPASRPAPGEPALSLSRIHKVSSGPGCSRPGDHSRSMDIMSASCAGQPSLARGQTGRPSGYVDGFSNDPQGGPASTGLGKTSLRRSWTACWRGLVCISGWFSACCGHRYSRCLWGVTLTAGFGSPIGEMMSPVTMVWIGSVPQRSLCWRRRYGR